MTSIPCFSPPTDPRTSVPEAKKEEQEQEVVLSRPSSSATTTVVVANRDPPFRKVASKNNDVQLADFVESEFLGEQNGEFPSDVGVIPRAVRQMQNLV
ncbi:hypothetical protein L1987_05567 [Smallanthus sonchifolius]|uniref:Uncharacterized protein n=1 Tax=Smallanthus sonchifolius TaxID=185202 RepID=A0ACB9JW00_9ASTR|nr:hypothetical protein L1987_05567 [Smallanthus sonchifolius]